MGFLEPRKVLSQRAGHLCVTVLRLLRKVPLSFSLALLRPTVVLYPLLRRRHARRLKRLLACAPSCGSFASLHPVSQRSSAPETATYLPFPSPRAPVSLKGYYKNRLELILRNLNAHGRPIAEIAIKIEGLEIYRAALQLNRPIALLGIHSGVVELMHKVPQAPQGRPFYVLTARAFVDPLTEFMARGRAIEGKQILWNDNIRSGLKKSLADNGVLAMMLDQFPGGAEAHVRLWNQVSVPYPKRMLEFLAGHSTLFIPVSTRLASDGISIFRFHPAWEATEDGRLSAEIMESRVQKFMEEIISDSPDQFNWSYPKLALSEDRASGVEAD